MFLLLCIYQSEASLLFWVKKGQNLKPPIQAHSFIYMQCLRGKSFRQRINIHPSLSCAHDPFTEFRDPFLSKVSVQRDPPASICRYRGCRLLSRSVGTFSLRLGRNVKRLMSLRICTPRSFFSLVVLLPCPYLVMKMTCCSVTIETVESCFTNEAFPGRSSSERSGD